MSEVALHAETDPSVDEVYLRVWEKQQQWTTTRWGIMTFFLGISFAIFGLSFSTQNTSQAAQAIAGVPQPLTLDATAQRLTGLAIYWFSFFVYRRYDDWSKFLRNYLYELELTTATRFKLQTQWRTSVDRGFRKWTSVTKLLVYFGVIYALSIVVLRYFNL